MALYGNQQLTGHERILEPNEIIVSKTDLTGKITYGNRTFYKLAGLSDKQTIGQQHNIIRHPHMPRCVFDFLWARLKDGKEVFAYVNNRAVNGDNYWVLAHVTPSFNEKGEIVSYHSNRRAPNRQVLEQHIIPMYKSLLDLEKSIESPKAALAASNAEIAKVLEQKNMSFNEFMYSLGT